MTEDNTKEFYDLTAEATADEWYRNDVLIETIKEFADMFDHPPRILDLGCGTGHESKRIASTGADVVGIDYSSECIRVARQRCKKGQFEVMDFFEIDDGLGKFDGIFASGSIIHVRPERIDRIFAEMSEVLNDNGYLLAIVQDGQGISEKWSSLKVNDKQLYRPVYCYTENKLVNAAKKNRFVFVKEGYLDKSLYEQGWRNYIFKRTSKK